MILLGSTLQNKPVMGLQTGGELARTKRPIIDPHNLVVLAYELTGPLIDKNNSVLIRIADVRELNNDGFIIDSSDEFIEPSDVVKINEVYQLGFNLLNTAVHDEQGRKLGKVIDFTIETGGFVVQQLTIRRPMLKSLNDTELIIHRSQIIEINNDGIIVHSEADVPEPTRSEVSGAYVNPFRKTESAQESTDVTSY